MTLQASKVAHAAVHGYAPASIKELLIVNNERTLAIKPPRFARAKADKLSPISHIARCWNDLDVELRKIPKASVFQKRLKLRLIAGPQ